MRGIMNSTIFVVNITKNKKLSYTLALFIE